MAEPRLVGPTQPAMPVGLRARCANLLDPGRGGRGLPSAAICRPMFRVGGRPFAPRCTRQAAPRLRSLPAALATSAHGRVPPAARRAWHNEAAAPTFSGVRPGKVQRELSLRHVGAFCDAWAEGRRWRTLQRGRGLAVTSSETNFGHGRCAGTDGVIRRLSYLSPPGESV